MSVLPGSVNNFTIKWNCFIPHSSLLFFREGSNDYTILSDVSCFILSHTKIHSFGGMYFSAKNPDPVIFITPIPKIPSFLSCSINISYLYPAFGAQFIYEFISKSINDLKFHPGQYKQLILWAHLLCVCVPPGSCMQQFAFLQLMHAHKTLVHIASMYRFWWWNIWNRQDKDGRIRIFVRILLTNFFCGMVECPPSYKLCLAQASSWCLAISKLLLK